MPLVPTLREQISEFEASLVYIASSRTVRVMCSFGMGKQT